MLTILLLLLLVLILMMAVAVYVPTFRVVTLLYASFLLYIFSILVWFGLQYFGIVRLTSLLNVYTHELVGTWLGILVNFGPPLLPPMFLLCIYFIRCKFEK